MSDRPNEHPPLAPEVAKDPGLAMLAQTLRSDSDAQVARSEAAGLDAQHGLAQLFERLDTEAPPIPEEQPTPRTGAPWWMVRTQAAAIVALAASLAVVALWLPSLQDPANVAPGGDIEVYSDTDGAAAPAQLRVVFDAETSVGEMKTILQSVGAEVTAGPGASTLGIFSLTLGREVSVASIDQALATLRGDARVLLAEPVAGAQADAPADAEGGR